MTPSTCQSTLCIHYRLAKDYSKFDQGSETWYKFDAHFCMHPALQAGKDGQPRKNRQVPGGSPIGLVFNTCKGKFFEART